MKINISFSEKMSHGYTPEIVDWEYLYTLTCMDLNYTAGRFQNGHRTTSNWRGGNNCVILDIDANVSIQQARNFLEVNDLKSLIITTKSHRVEKNGVVCDRFRIIVPMKSALYCAPEHYKKLFVEINKFFMNAADIATKDPSRFYYGNAKQAHWYIEGDVILDWSMFQPEEVKPVKKAHSNSGDAKALIEWGLRNVRAGNRNNALYWIAKESERSGYDPDVIVNAVNDGIKDPLPLEEIKVLLRKA